MPISAGRPVRTSCAESPVVVCALPLMFIRAQGRSDTQSESVSAINLVSLISKVPWSLSCDNFAKNGNSWRGKHGFPLGLS